ncbi:MAG: acyltransferase [Hyphomonadaceae bacterium]|nr:acyltransferase [Hyphomonadaceae bacterium]
MDQRASQAPDLLSAQQTPQRNVGLDVARGLLMAWIIVAVHGVFWLRLAPTGPASLFLFEMPPVFMITGAAYFLGEGAKRGRLQPGAYFDFLLRRGVRIYLPYLAYVLVAAAIVTAVRWDGNITLAEIAARIVAWINPLQYGGGGHTWKMLSWHLWFVGPFLLVTALLPFIAVRAPGFMKPWMLAVLGGLAILGLGQLSFAPGVDGLIKNAVFYAFWAVFGFMLAASPRRWSIGDYAVLLVLALAGMAAAKLALPGQVSLDMQHNKFPPNAMFFLFSCAWMALFLIAVRFITGAQIEAMARSPLLKPFISAGYSIYLWQGAGYSLMSLAGDQLGLSNYLVWLAAIALTVALGLLFAPLERIRLPKRRAA